MANIVHSSTPEGEHQFMQEQMAGVARKYNTVKNEKEEAQTEVAILRGCKVTM